MYVHYSICILPTRVHLQLYVNAVENSLSLVVKKMAVLFQGQVVGKLVITTN